MSCCGNYVVPGAAPSGNVTVSAGFGIVVEQPSPGEYIVSTNGETLDQTTLPNFIAASPVSIGSGGNPVNFGAVPFLGPFDPVLNPELNFELIMSCVADISANNILSMGIYRTIDNSEVVTLEQRIGPPTYNLNINWGTAIPDPLNVIVRNVSVPNAVASGGLYYGAFLRFVGSNATFNNLSYVLSVKYYV